MVDNAAVAQALAAHLRNSGDWLEAVPGIDTVVVRFDAATIDAAEARRRFARVLAGEIPSFEAPDALIEIPVVYGGDQGPDFDAVCEALGLSGEEFIALHTACEYVVELVGFTPGFVYVGGLDDRLLVPRRGEPRQEVPPGSVGIADGRTGLYALPGPGGWPLVGWTPFTLFDRNAENPFPIEAGMRIRFIAIEADGQGS
jgi:allophanate hydrolase